MRYRRAEGVLEEVVDGRAMLVTPDGTELLTLNETGSAIWSALAEPQTAATLADRLHQQMGVDRSVLEEDASSFLDELSEAEVVVEADGS